MSVEETSNEQAAIPEKVCSHTQSFALPPYNVVRLNMPSANNAVSGDVLERVDLVRRLLRYSPWDSKGRLTSFELEMVKLYEEDDQVTLDDWLIE